MTKLEAIVARRRASVERAKSEKSIDQLRDAADRRTAVRRFVPALASRRPAIIAEIKRRSPSAGVISDRVDAAALAVAYAAGGASALSVVTEPEFFGGSLEDLRAARAATVVPVLRKDFIIDPYQVWETAAAGADAVLVIAAALSPQTLRSCVALARELGIEPLVEVHDEAEVPIALDAGARCIGINNRDLHTFAVDLSTAPRIAAVLPPYVTVIAESGYRTADDVARCTEAGIHAVLIGEALMRAADPAAALAQLRSVRI
ncbi:MAG TPA: indole-3-glycerol phosphate synthase TrpC [Candidatus Eremiobacteraceae bacterium]|nr:indole-3-glycerol phosphate synthase TrpC [Candidatus Eremiobacteraceae bacterium]